MIETESATYIYLFCSTMLTFIFSGIAEEVRDEAQGWLYVILWASFAVITAVRFGNIVSKFVYRKVSGQKKRLTLLDFVPFDFAMYALYGLVSALGSHPKNITAVICCFLVGLPVLGVCSYLVFKRFKSIYELKAKWHKAKPKKPPKHRVLRLREEEESDKLYR